MFGENTASAILIIKATSSSIGTIIHSNEEIEQVLGYQRQDIIGRNINMIMPRPISIKHDLFVKRYFETAKPTVIDIKRQLLGKAKDGYLQSIELIVKVYPHLTDKIIFVGFIQKASSFRDMEPLKSELEHLESNYIITDDVGNITNLTEGLSFDLGLNAKFFNYNDSIFT